MATQKEVAEHIDISDRRVRDLLANGVLPKAKGPGGLNLDACRIAYINYLRSNAGKSPDPVTLDIDIELERARLTKEKADAQELENRVKRGELMPVDLLGICVSSIASRVHSVLSTLPTKIKRKQPNLSNTALDEIKKEIALAQNACADSHEILEEVIEQYAAD